MVNKKENPKIPFKDKFLKQTRKGVKCHLSPQIDPEDSAKGLVKIGLELYDWAF